MENHILNRVQCFKSGKCTCDCNFFGRNSVCHICLAIGIHLICVAIIVKAYGSQNMSNIFAAATPKNVRVKAPFRKRLLPETEQWCTIHWIQIWLQKKINFDAETVNPTTLVIRRTVRPVDPPPPGPLVVIKIASNIRKCAGCYKAIKRILWDSIAQMISCIVSPDLSAIISVFNKGTNAWQLLTSTRHYHLNPVCTKVSLKIATDSSLILTGSLC